MTEPIETLAGYSQPPPPPVSTGEPMKFQTATVSAVVFCLGLALSLGLACFGLAADKLRLGGNEYSFAYVVIGMVRISVTFISAIPFAFWLTRVYQNGEALARKRGSLSSALVAASPFIPLFGLLAPLIALNDAAKPLASKGPLVLAYIWWIVWVAAFLCALILPEVPIGIPDLTRQRILDAQLFIIIDQVCIAAAILGMAAVITITVAQGRMKAAISAATNARAPG